MAREQFFERLQFGVGPERDAFGFAVSLHCAASLFAQRAPDDEGLPALQTAEIDPLRRDKTAEDRPLLFVALLVIVAQLDSQPHDIVIGQEFARQLLRLEAINYRAEQSRHQLLAAV